MGRKRKEAHALSGVMIGRAECGYCREPVEVRVAETGTAFANCRGVLSERACGTRTWFGVRASRELIERYKEAEGDEVRSDDTERDNDGDAGAGSGDGSDGGRKRGFMF